MPLHDYMCPDGYTFEAFRPYGNHRTAPDPRDDSRDFKPCDLVWLRSGNIWTDESGDRAYRRKLEARGARQVEPGMDRDVERAAKERKQRQARERRKKLEEIAAEW